MSYIAKFLKANSAQLLTAALSAVDVYLIIYHPELRKAEMVVLTALAGFGLHIERIVYTKEDIHERLGLPLPSEDTKP